MIQITAEAGDELVVASDWFENEAGLGSEFNSAIRLKLSEIDSAPMQYPELQDGVRYAIVPRFSYAIVFQVLAGGVIDVVAIAHPSRQPGYWLNRL